MRSLDTHKAEEPDGFVGTGDLGDITVAVTSFLRWGYLERCLNEVHRFLHECPVIVADCSDTDKCAKVAAGNEYIQLPFDSGLSRMRNAIVQNARTPYLLLFCDDFSAASRGCRSGVLKMLDVLERNPDIALAGGRVNSFPYEAFLEYVPGEHIRETRMIDDGHSDIQPCDLTVNYFLARTEVLKQFPWPTECIIGGEHVCLFLDLKMGGKKVCWARDANIRTLSLGEGPEAQDPRYRSFRNRAYDLGHQAMMRRYGIGEYLGCF